MDNEAEMKAIIDRLIALFKSLFGKPYVPPEEPPEPIPKPQPTLQPPIITQLISRNDDKEILVNYIHDGDFVNVISSNTEFEAYAPDAESPLTITADSTLGSALKSYDDGTFYGDIVITLVSVKDGVESLPSSQRMYITPRPEPVDPPSVKPPKPSEPKLLREINLSSINNAIKKATHTSLRSVQLLEDDALISFESAGHVFSVRQGRFVGQIATGGGANKAEFSPSYYGDYYYNRNGGLVRKNLFDPNRTKTLFSLNDVKRRYNQNFDDVVSGPHEHNLVNDELIAKFRAPIGARNYVFGFDANDERFLDGLDDFTQRNGEPDFCGMAGTNFVVKNVRQLSDNTKDAFDLFPIQGKPFTADRKGMNHSCFDGKHFVSTAKWYMDAQGVTTSLSVPLDTAEHVGRVHGLDGWCIANRRNGDVLFFETETSTYHVIASDCKSQGYPVGFVLDNLLHLVITNNSGVYMRIFEI